VHKAEYGVLTTATGHAAAFKAVMFSADLLLFILNYATVQEGDGFRPSYGRGRRRRAT
jgi:hypothetical protein